MNQLYFNKVDISLSKGGTSCLGYEMMAVAKKSGISTLIVSCNNLMFENIWCIFQTIQELAQMSINFTLTKLRFHYLRVRHHVSDMK